MKNTCRIRISRHHFNMVDQHLFPGDQDEHGAVLLAGMSSNSGQITLHVREVHLAKERCDYIEGKIGYRALTPKYIHRLITRARDENLVYLAVHNHGSDRNVGFSMIDLESHERGYPALLQIAKGMPIGGMVFGQRSAQVDLWLPSGKRLELDEVVIVGNRIDRLTPAPREHLIDKLDTYDRQVRMFGSVGQVELGRCRVAIIGLGGIGSLLAEYLARLGVGEFHLVDNDCVEVSNLSRIAGASDTDARDSISKLVVAQRLIKLANPNANVRQFADDFAKESVAKAVTSCDYLFLAADSMRARLVFNAIINQYLIPGVQLGSKIRSDKHGVLTEIMSANRPIRPGHGCLFCNQLIDATQLAQEAKSDEERRAQAYGVEEPNPSVITLNGICAAHAANDFMMDYLGLRDEAPTLYYEHFHFLRRTRSLVAPRKDTECSECAYGGLRYGRGDAVELPCIEE